MITAENLIQHFEKLRIGYVFSVLFLAALSELQAQQEIPLGTWREHISFNAVSFLASGDSKVFAASENAVLRFDPADQSFEVYSNLNALSGNGITAMVYDEQREQLIVAYEHGGIDFIRENETLTYDRLTNLPDVSVSLAIRHIRIAESNAYLSTAYGVVVFDLQRNEVRETWRNLGIGGLALAINQSAILNDSIYLATSNGIIKGSLTANLLDFNQWQRFGTGDLNAEIGKISSINNKIVAGINERGVYKFNGTDWQLMMDLPVLNEYTLFSVSGNTLFLGSQNRLVSTQDLINSEDRISDQFSSVEDALLLSNEIWIADSGAGFLREQGDGWQLTIPNGPASPFIFKTGVLNNQILAIHGGYSTQFLPNPSINRISVFENGLWSFRDTEIDHITDVEEGNGGELFISSFSEGIEKVSADGTSTLFSADDYSFPRITSIKNSSNGLWISSYNTISSLHLLKADNTISSFISSSLAGRYPIGMEVDGSGNVWMLLAQIGGGGVLIIRNDGTELRLLTEQPGSGLLPDREVLSIAVDKNDYVWIGTAEGVAYYTSYSGDGVRPIVDGRFLLNDERITALAIDEGNRKWIGTERGLWLFDEIGEEVIHNFTMENSPLPSNVILDLELNLQNGELFITTDKGLVSFRSDATAARFDFESVKIFPNPVTPSFNGLVGINNLMENATVKIVDVSGKLVNQIQGNGGAASWNLTDHNGKRVTTGVYLLIAILPDGSESFAGKLVVLD